MDWQKGFSASYYATFVDSATWRDVERFEITEGSISYNTDDLRCSATVGAVGYEQGTENIIRVYLDARQTGDAVLVPLFTGYATSPSQMFNGRLETNSLDVYSVLTPVKDVLLPRGWYATAEIPGGDLIKKLLEPTPAPVVIEDESPALKEAIIAEDAGAVAVMALEKVPADIRAAGGVARMADPTIVEEVVEAVSIPVMAKARIGHIAEAQILETLGVDMIDESEVLTPADEEYHINKKEFTIPFVCGARNLGEALRRIDEGASMIRTKGEPGTGNIVEAVRHMRMVMGEIRTIQGMEEEELWKYARNIEAPIELVKETAELGKLPVVNFAAGGIATPADASLMMQLGSDGIFVGSGIFKSKNPEAFAKAIVEATANYDKPEVLADVSKGLGEAMKGLEMSTLNKSDRMQDRGI